MSCPSWPWTLLTEPSWAAWKKHEGRAAEESDESESSKLHQQQQQQLGLNNSVSVARVRGAAASEFHQPPFLLAPSLRNKRVNYWVQQLVEREKRAWVSRDAVPLQDLTWPRPLLSADATTSGCSATRWDVVRFFFFFELLMFSLQLFSTDEIIFFGKGVELVWKHHLEERKEKQLGSDFFFCLFFYLWGCVCLQQKNQTKQKEQIFCICCHPQSRKCEAGL